MYAGATVEVHCMCSIKNKTKWDQCEATGQRPTILLLDVRAHHYWKHWQSMIVCRFCYLFHKSLFLLGSVSTFHWIVKTCFGIYLDTIEGIVSGGVGQCGKGRKDGTKEGVPRWNTRVAVYRDWINCIHDGIMEKKTKKATENLCNWKFAVRGDQFPPKNMMNFT